MPQRITILGSTGSIGCSTLQVLALHPERFEVFALTANNNVDVLFEQCIEYKPRYAVLSDEKAAQLLTQKLAAQHSKIEVLTGIKNLMLVASHADVDCVMAAIVGAAGLIPTLAAAQAGKRVLLANKEALVMSGNLFMDAVKKSGAILLPIDSEHNAILQCLPGEYRIGGTPTAIRKIMLTASGGPFLHTSISELSSVTPEQACAHPNWVMGKKISVDSATMMNKGLELIEACWLFALSPSQVEVVIHPQSIVHSLVGYQDGSVLAQMGKPDMRTPIAYGLSWPERIESGVDVLDLMAQGTLEFFAPDKKRFPCLQLAIDAFQAGSAATIALNAANEVAVQAFLSKRIAFTDIATVINKVLDRFEPVDVNALDTILVLDNLARKLAAESLSSIKV